MKRKQIQKHYWEMNLQELEEATKEFDGPIDLSKIRPLTKAQRARFERDRRRGSVSISAMTLRPISLEIRFDERFMRNSIKEASKRGVPLYKVLETEFRKAAKWFEFTWKHRKR
jgi:hypothetical protein